MNVAAAISTDETDRAARIAALGYDYDAQPKQRHGACNLCGGAVFVTVSHRDRYGFAASAQACRACGLTFLNPVMTAEAYGAFYRDTYRPLVSAYHGRLIDAATVQADQKPYAARLAEQIAALRGGRRGGALLDIGGSTGIVAHAVARRCGMEATVIDPAPMEVAVAERLGISCITGLVEDYDPGPQRFDLILICQTIDHVLDLKGTIAKSRRLLNEGGLLFVDIVDFRAAFRRTGAVEAAIKIDHPYYLTEETMEACLTQCGFAVLALDYAPDHLHVGFFCRPDTPRPEARRDADAVRGFFRELRAIQNRVPP